MIVEIKSIETEYMDTIIKELRGHSMRELATVVMLWSFGVDWDDDEILSDYTEDQIIFVYRLFQANCSSFIMKIDEHELRSDI